VSIKRNSLMKAKGQLHRVMVKVLQKADRWWCCRAPDLRWSTQTSSGPSPSP